MSIRANAGDLMNNVPVPGNTKTKPGFTGQGNDHGPRRLYAHAHMHTLSTDLESIYQLYRARMISVDDIHELTVFMCATLLSLTRGSRSSAHTGVECVSLKTKAVTPFLTLYLLSTWQSAYFLPF